MSAWSYSKEGWSLSFVFLTILILFLSRMGGCIGLYLIVRAFNKFKNEITSINMYHVWIIWFAGVVRGAIAFALII